MADVCAEAIYKGRPALLFRNGTLHMICEEPFYRAGGLASIYPILESGLMLHEGASKEQQLRAD